MNKALIIIDVQRDFCEGGVLPARRTGSLIKPLNKAIAWSVEHSVACIFTRDWHPPDHCSFTSQGGNWPPHCVQGTSGAEFAKGLNIPDSTLVIDIEKDSNKASMSYSAFENTNLEHELRSLDVIDVAASGIATEYCVAATVLDALRYGFKVSVLTDLIRPIDVKSGDSNTALAEMKAAGATLLTSKEWLNSSIVRLGRHENFHNNVEIRLLSIEKAIADYHLLAQRHKAKFQDKIDEHTVLFLKGLGNDIAFLSCFKELFFNSRELLDILLTKLNKVTDSSKFQTSKKFLVFAREMMRGKYDGSNLAIIKFLKTNIMYIFQIRKVRNEIKNNPSNIDIRYVNKLEAVFEVPINNDEKELVQYLDIENKDEAVKKGYYNCTYFLDEIFPQMPLFWRTCLSILDDDIKALTTGRP
ncbi:MAG: isochorismatase family protein [Nitrospirae bacterium]|nr:isochorismatase family protein [Nitrospirota bacterium]